MEKSHKGFTLIELLVIIAIIGILSSVVFASIGVAREKARDAKRLAELESIQKALVLYYDNNQSYPETVPAGYTGAIQMLVSTGLLSADPTVDPFSVFHYYGGVEVIAPFTECTAPGCLGYSVSVLLERSDNIALSSDKGVQVRDAGGAVIFEGNSIDCGTAAIGVGESDFCLDRTN